MTKFTLHVNDEEIQGEWEVISTSEIVRYDDCGFNTVLLPAYHLLKVNGFPDRRFRSFEVKGQTVILSDEIA